MPDYANGKIYCIRNRADNDRIVYIGSTVRPLSERMSDHRKTIVRKPNIKFYKLMAEVGVEHFHIELITAFPCESIEQLVAEEGRHIRLNDTLTDGVNSKMAGRSPQQYRVENRDTLLEKKKQLYIDNRDAILEKSKVKYAANIDAIRQYKREYRQQHVEQFKAYGERRVARRAELKRLAEAAAPVEA